MNSLDLKNSLDKEGITPNMGKIHRSVVLLVVVCYFLCFIQTAASVRTFYLDDQCDPNITDSQTFYYFVGSPTDNSNSSGILKNSLTNDYFPNIICNAVLSPIGQSGITLSIWRIDLRENCRDNLTFVDSLGVSASFCNSVKNFQESWSFSSNGPLTIQFKTGSEPSNITKGGFEIIFTSFRGSPCPGIGFECQNSHCIWNGLRCNGYNNCGDGSDEEKCLYVDNFCNSTKTSSPTEHEIELTMPEESSGILKAVRAGIYRSDLNCKIIFTPKMEGGIIMSIRMIDFRLNCHDNLTIDDVDGRHTYCNSTFDEMEETSHYSSGSLTIHYQTGKYDGIYLHSGFELIYTAYSVPLCTHEEFECPRGCIWRNLKCDGHNHCGDRSDQKDCPATRYPKAAKPMEVGKIVAIACSCLLILLASVTAIIFVRKRKPKPTADIVLQQRCRGEPYGARFPAPGMYPESLCPQPGEMYYPPPQYSPSDGKQGGKNDRR